MPNIIRIKRSTGSTAPTTLKNAELAYAEGNNTLYIGAGISSGDTASSIIKIGGSGAFLTIDTAQTINNLGVKTFNTTNFKLTGGSSGQVLSTNGSGDLTWASSTANAFSTITGNTGSTTASGADSLAITGSGAISVAVTSPSGADTATISVAQASTTNLGVVELAAVIDASTTKVVTPSLLKGYVDTKVDAVASGLDIKGSCRVATAAALPNAPTYSPTNKTLIASSNGALTVDGVLVQVNDRILVKNQSEARQNGIYVVTAKGADFNAAYTLTRADDANVNSTGAPEKSITAGMFTFIEEGTNNQDTAWVLTTNNPITIDNATLENNTALTFTQFAGPGTVTAGTGLSRTGNEISLSVPVVATRGGTGQTTYTAGDILYSNATDTLDKLSIGSANHVLRVSGGKPGWGQVSLTAGVTGTLPIANGGTNATTADGALGQLGANTIGLNIFKLANPGAITFLRLNADNTVTARSAADFRSDIGAGTGNGTVTSVTGTGGISVATGTTTPGISLAAAYGDTTNPYGTKTANSVLAGPTTGAATAPTFRALVEADIPNISAGKLTSGTAGGKITFTTPSTNTFSNGASINLPASSISIADYDNGVPGDIWNSVGTLRFKTGSGVKTIAFTDSNITGTAAGLSSTLAVGSGGTGQVSFQAGKLLKGNGTNALAVADAGTDFVVAGTTTVGKIIFANATTSIASANLGTGTADPTTPVNGDFWNNAGTLKLYYGATKTVLLDDSTLDGGSFP